MSLDNFIPQLWYNSLLSNLQSVAVGESFVNHDYEPRLLAGGESIALNIMNDIVTKKYTGADIDYDEVGTKKVILQVDQSYYCACAVYDVDKAQAAGPVMHSYTMNMAQSMQKNYDTFIFNTLKTSATAKPTNMVGTDAAPIDASGSNSNAAVDALIDAIAIANANNIPTEGRVAAIGPSLNATFMKSDKRSINPLFAQFTSRGYVGNFYGVEVFTTNNLAKSTSGNDLIIVTHPKMTTVATQIMNVEAMRSEKKFSDLLRALHVFGAKVIYEDGVVGAYVKTKAAG